MIKIDKKKILMDGIKRISEHYSKVHQIKKTKEELRELLAELEAAQIINGEIVLPGNTWSEVADVIIMCTQIVMQHKKENKVTNQIEYKVNRQLRRIEAEKKRTAWQQEIMNRFTEIK